MYARKVTPRSTFPFWLLLCLLLSVTAHAGPVVYLDQYGEPVGIEMPEAVDAASALQVLVSTPPGWLNVSGLTSAIPPGTKILGFTVGDDGAVVNFSKQLLARDAGDARLEMIFQQVKWTVWNYLGPVDVTILMEGIPYAEYAMPAPTIQPRAAEALFEIVGGLSGRSVTISPGHGWFWNGSVWATQRPVYCSPLNEEDFHNLEMCQYLETYLLNDGCTVKMVRCTDKNYGNHSSGKPWWQMAACYWLQNRGYPCSVYGSYSGCTLGSGATEVNDDIRSRPLASDYDNTNIFVSLHTNGYSGDCTGATCPRGTDTYYDCSTEHANWCTVSQNLASAVHSAVISTIRNNCDPNWVDRGTHNSNGAYGEIRIPDRAAILMELGFHDTCDYDADANHLRDNFFRSTAMWGIYKGICDYFGTTPTWGYYSDELVGHTIPSTMTTGETRSVSVTFRNKGVLWSNKWGFKLGAVGDSDPFTATTRHLLASEVGPNGTYTFTFNLTAPSTPGTYTTDWRMLREGVTWFGATASQNVVVSAPAPAEVILDNNQAGFSASSNWSTGTMSTDKYGADYRFRSTQAISDPATWQVTLPSAGTYAVYAWWPQGSNRSTSAPYIIYHNGGSTTVRVNQQVNGGKWNLLGTWDMGTTGKVQLSCWTTTGYVVVADAIKWVKQ